MEGIQYICNVFFQKIYKNVNPIKLIDLITRKIKDKEKLKNHGKAH